MECCKEADFDGPFNDAGKKCLAAQFASYEKNGVVCCGVIWAADEAVLSEERKNEKVTHDQQGKGKMDVNCC